MIFFIIFISASAAHHATFFVTAVISIIAVSGDDAFPVNKTHFGFCDAVFSVLEDEIFFVKRGIVGFTSHLNLRELTEPNILTLRHNARSLWPA